VIDLHRLRLWLRSLLRTRQVERDLDDEVRLHVELEIRKNMEAGMDAAQARRKAMIDFGGVERYKEQTRDARDTRPLEDALMDLRYGFRQLLTHPGFTAVALLSLALGIGANTAIFSVVNTVLLQPLPFSHPDRIVAIEEHASGERNTTFSPRDFLDVKEQAASLEVVVGHRSGSMALTGSGTPVRVQTRSVTPDFFRAFGASPALGRFFEATPEEDDAGKLVVLSHATWQARFGGDPAVLGRTLSLNGEPHTVVGVARPTFRYPEGTEFWVRSYREGLPEPPVDIGDELSTVRGLGYFSVLARLAPDVSLGEARSELGVLAGRIAAFKDPGTDYRLELVPLRDTLVGDVRPALLVLLGAVGLVLLIACANVANLLLARAASRGQELAVRAALGARRNRLFRQLLVESLLLGVVAGFLGILLARWGFGALLTLLPADIPRLDGIALDPPVLFFTLGVALLTGVAFGLMPALDASRADLVGVMKTGGRGVVGGGRARRIRELLVVGEVALSVVLLSGAGLLLKSLVRLQDEDVGFLPEGVLVVRMNLPDSRYPDESSVASFVREMVRAVEEVPGVSSAGVALGAPFAGGAATMGYEVEGMPQPEGEEFVAEYQVVTPDYFRTMGIPILEGRGLEPADGEGEGGPLVAVVNEAFARRHWGEGSPLGQQINFFDDTPMEIVGVSGDVRHFSYERAPRPEAYVPFFKDPWPFFSLVAKAQGDPRLLVDPLRQAVLDVDPDQPVSGVRPMVQVLAESTGKQRFTVELLGMFAALAVMLALVGVYGVMAYAVSLRTREVGIRVALGAPRGEILWTSLRNGMHVTAMGLGLGVGGGLALTRILGSLLYGVSPWDPGVFSLAALLLACAVMAAAYLPARRAAGMDPARILRSE
jgi:predicted permease